MAPPVAEGEGAADGAEAVEEVPETLAYDDDVVESKGEEEPPFPATQPDVSPALHRRDAQIWEEEAGWTDAQPRELSYPEIDEECEKYTLEDKKQDLTPPKQAFEEIVDESMASPHELREAQEKVAILKQQLERISLQRMCLGLHTGIPT